MVGVKGKYKGCNTCRARRVKCDNERPTCKKCSDTGRQCGGYERETVFIIGTMQGRGRVSSHPPRVMKERGEGGGGGASGSGSGSGGGEMLASGAGRLGGMRKGSAAASTTSSSSGGQLAGFAVGADASSPAPSSDTFLVVDPDSASAHFGGGGGAPSDRLQLAAAPPFRPAWGPYVATTAAATAATATAYGYGAAAPPPPTPIDLRLWALTTALDGVRRDPVGGGGGGGRRAGGHHHGKAVAGRGRNAAPSGASTDGGDDDDDTAAGGWFRLALPRYVPPHAGPSGREDDFDLRCEVLVHLAGGVGGHPGGSMGRGPGPEVEGEENVCLFLFEHNASSMVNNLPPWKLPDIHSFAVKRLGPEHFREFPAHHFFVRVYRHSAICSALLNRRPCFLSAPEWTTAPWENHQKTLFDRLFDVVALVPALLWRADALQLERPSISRRLKAQDLLANCMSVEKSFAQWYAGLQQDFAGMQLYTYVSEPQHQSPSPQDHRVPFPFQESYSFCDNTTAMTFLFYWTTLILFYQCIESVQAAVFEPVVDAFPQHYYPTSLPPQLRHWLGIDPPSVPGTASSTGSGSSISAAQQPAAGLVRYGPATQRDLAAEVLRSLGFALATCPQPDLLACPLLVAHEFFRSLVAGGGGAHGGLDGGAGGELELEWCEAFMGRLAAHGQAMAESAMTCSWTEIARF